MWMCRVGELANWPMTYLKEHEIEDSIGIDEEGVTEDFLFFQYHGHYLMR